MKKLSAAAYISLLALLLVGVGFGIRMYWIHGDCFEAASMIRPTQVQIDRSARICQVIGAFVWFTMVLIVTIGILMANIFSAIKHKQ